MASGRLMQVRTWGFARLAQDKISRSQVHAAGSTTRIAGTGTVTPLTAMGTVGQSLPGVRISAPALVTITLSPAITGPTDGCQNRGTPQAKRYSLVGLRGTQPYSYSSTSAWSACRHSSTAPCFS